MGMASVPPKIGLVNLDRGVIACLAQVVLSNGLGVVVVVVGATNNQLLFSLNRLSKLSTLVANWKTVENLRWKPKD